MSSTTLPKFPFIRQLGYASGSLGYSMVDRLLASAIMFFYVPPDGSGMTVYMVPKMFGLIMIFGRVIDTVADPLVSFWTDRSKSPRGRRVPFMMYGGLPLVLTLCLLLFPPVKGLSGWNTLYVAGFLGAYFFFFTYYVCPYLALVPELSRTQNDRINLTSLKGFFMLLGTILASVFWAPIAGAYGYKMMAVIFGVGGLIFVYMPVLAVDEKKYCESKTCELSIKDSLFTTFKNRPFVIYLIGNITFWFGFNIIASGVTYYITVLLGLGEEMTANYMAAVFGVTLIFIPILNIVTKRIGKRNIAIILLLMFAVILPCIYFLNATWLPVPNTLALYIILALAGIPLAGLFIVPDAIVADMTDYDEMLTGERHEAMYFGAQGFCLKSVLGLSTFLMTVLFEQFGHSVEHPLGVQLTGPVAGLFALIGAIAFMFFPKDIEAKVEQFRLEKENK